MNSGKHGEAAVQFEAAVRSDPNFASAYNNLGIQYARLGRPAEGQAALERAVALDPDTWQASYNLGAVSYLLGDFSAAERSARRAVELSRDNALPHLLLGSLLCLHRETRAEGVRHVQYAARTIPAAQKLLDKMQRRVQAP